MRLRILLSAAVIFVLNAVVAHRLFAIDFTSHMESTEGAFIAISRYATQHWGHLDWLPIWFTGMPFDNVYQPGYHLTVAALSTLFGFTPQHAYHLLAATVYCLGPVTLFLAAWYFTRRVDVALVTAMVYSVVSPSCLLIADIRADTGGWFAYRRYLNVIKYADTPHLAAVMLLPLAIIAIDLAVVQRRWGAIPIATVLTSAIVLTNWPGTVGFAMALFAYVIARYHDADRSRLLLIGVASYLIAIPWVPPSTLMSVQRNAQQSDATAFGIGHVVYAAVLLAIVAALAWNFHRWNASVWLRFTCLLAVISGATVMSRYWFHFQFLPQPHRWHVEMDMAIAATVVLIAARFRPALIALGVLSIVLAPQVVSYANSLTTAIDVTKTTEYRIAKWFARNAQGSRVFVPGSVSIWMNNFTDNPQFAGCCDPGVPSFMHRVALHTVYSGQNAGPDYVPVSTIWLQAYGVHAIAVTGSDSGEMFHPYAHPEAFHGQLPELWHEGDDTIYEVPHLTNSLAHIINSTDAVLREPVHGLDVAPLRPYVAALVSTAYPEASFDWTGTSSAHIETSLHADQLVSVQVTYDRAWRAYVNGIEKPVSRDALDLMLIHPGVEGDCKIDLIYRSSYRTALRFAAAAGWAACLFAAVWARRRTVRTV